MSTAAVVGIAVAGALGAPTRYLVDGFVQDRSRGSFPWGTFTVNTLGSFALGIVVGLEVHHGFTGAPRLWLATGFCGAFTTFSTFAWETVRLVEEDDLVQAARNLAASVGVGLLAASAGMSIVLLFG